MSEFAMIGDLVGKTLSGIVMDGDEIIFEIIFVADDGSKFKMYHKQEGCESVYIDDIVGDLSDLVGSPILLSEDVSGVMGAEYGDSGITIGGISCEESEITWTFYKIATIKGSVTIRWFGTSNGFYSVSVDFIKIS